MGAHALTEAQVAATRRGLPAARAALAGTTPLTVATPPTTCPHPNDLCIGCTVCGGDYGRCPVSRRRTTDVTVRVTWDPAVQDHPATWRWDLGLDAAPGTIQVVEP